MQSCGVINSIPPAGHRFCFGSSTFFSNDLQTSEPLNEVTCHIKDHSWLRVSGITGSVTETLGQFGPGETTLGWELGHRPGFLSCRSQMCDLRSLDYFYGRQFPNNNDGRPGIIY